MKTSLCSFWRKKYNIALIAFGMAVLAGYGFWKFQKPKFQDVTVELGEKQLTIQDFETEHAWSDRVKFVSDPSGIDLGQVGQTQLTLSHGLQEQTVTLQVVDTTAPSADILQFCQVPANQIPAAETLVSNVQDLSEVKIYYKQEPVIPLDYRDMTVTVVVEDAFGNMLQQDCLMSFLWLREEYTLEMGEELTKEKLLYNPERDATLLDQVQLNKIKAAGIGEYTVTSVFGDREQTCTLTVQDTRGPTLILKNVQCRSARKLKMQNFISSVTDPSGVAEVRLLSQINVKNKGSYPVVIEAEDNCGNITQAEAVLWVADDFQAPKISGDMSELILEKNSDLPDLLEGITAKDNKDGALPVECDTNGLDLSVGGTTYITYRATDSSGNKAEKKRKITVLHDEADTQALVQSIADQFDDDVTKMRHYVYYNIGYNHDWGGDDPVWIGFTEKQGNCYVHTMCLKALLDVKGIENQLIWTTDKSHYWLLVKVDNAWKHVDPTPCIEPLQPLMNDKQRLDTLFGRVWDTSLWPVCN